MVFFHNEEKYQVQILEEYIRTHEKNLYNIQFANGEEYLTYYNTSWESDNSGELEIDLDDPQYDEFYQMSFDIYQIVRDGNRRYHDNLTIDYRDFPKLITDITTGSIVYSAATDPTRR